MFKKAKKFFFSSKAKDARLAAEPSLQKSSRRDVEQETPFGPARVTKSIDSFGSERGSKKQAKGGSSSLKDCPIEDLDFRTFGSAKKYAANTRGPECGDVARMVAERIMQEPEPLLVLDIEEIQAKSSPVCVPALEAKSNPVYRPAPEASPPEAKVGEESIDSTRAKSITVESKEPLSGTWMREFPEEPHIEVCNTTPVISIEQRAEERMEVESVESFPILKADTSLEKSPSSMRDMKLDLLVEQAIVSPTLIIPPLPLKSIEKLVVQDMGEVELNEGVDQETLLLESNQACVGDEDTLLHMELDVPEALLRFELTVPSAILKTSGCDDIHEEALRDKKAACSPPKVSLDPYPVLEPDRIYVSPKKCISETASASPEGAEVAKEDVHIAEPMSNETIALEHQAVAPLVESTSLFELEKQTSSDELVSQPERTQPDIFSLDQASNGESKIGPIEPTCETVSAELGQHIASDEIESAAVSLTVNPGEDVRSLELYAAASAYTKALEKCADRFASEIKLITYDQKYAITICSCPLIGDRHLRFPVSVETRTRIIDEMRNEDCPLEFLDDGIDLQQSILKAYVQEPWLSSAVNAAQLARDETRQELATFTRVLHDTLADPPESIRRWTDKCWRWLKHPQDFPMSTLVSFSGFTSATRDSSTVWRQLSEYYGSDTLLVFIQDAGQGPVDVSRFSKAAVDFEVIYPLGQQFRVTRTEEWSLSDMQQQLGSEGSFDDGLFPKTVIHLGATDAFYEFASDLYRVGESKSQAVEILEKRLLYERSFGNEPHRALLYLGRAKREMGDLRAAETCMLEALQIRTQKGILETKDGSGLLMSLGMVKFEQGLFQEAAYYYSEARAVLVRMDDLWNAGAATLMASLGATKRVLGDLDGALAAFQEAEGIHKYLNSLSSPAGAALIASVARTYHDMQEYEKALEAYVRSKRLAEVTNSLWTANGGVLMTSIGTILRTLGDCASALKAYEKARLILISIGTLETPGGAALLTSIGTSRHASQNFIGGFVAHKEATSVHHKLGLDDVPFGLFAWEQLQAVIDDCNSHGCLDEAMTAWQDYCVRGAAAWQDYTVPHAFVPTPTSPASSCGQSVASSYKPILQRVEEEPAKIEKRDIILEGRAESCALDKYGYFDYGGQSSDDDVDILDSSGVSA